MLDARNKLTGERVRYYRTAREMSLQKLADSLPVPVGAQQLSKYENGVSRWPADLVCDLAKVLRVDVRLLLGLEDGKHEGKDSAEWDAERYKHTLLNMTQKARRVAYRIIDGVATL